MKTASLKEFEEHRRKNSGVAIFLPLIEYVRGIDLPDAVLENEIFREMVTATVDVVGYSNVSGPGTVTFRDYAEVMFDDIGYLFVQRGV